MIPLENYTYWPFFGVVPNEKITRAGQLYVVIGINLNKFSKELNKVDKAISKVRRNQYNRLRGI